MKRFVAALFGFLAWIGFVAVVTVGLGLLFIFVVVGSGCGSYVVQVVPSPDEQEKIVVYQRDCGATTGFRTHIALLDSSATIGSQTGNIFQADGHPDWFSFKVAWEDNENILIEHNGKPIADIANTEVKGKKIRYVENRDGIVPPRSFQPRQLLLPVWYFPQGWTGEEWEPLGPEIIRDSKKNAPYMLYAPPNRAGQNEARHYIKRLDNDEQAIAAFQRDTGVLKERLHPGCEKPNSPSAKHLFVQSEFTENLVVGFLEHRYSDSSGQPTCILIAQYEEFYIRFEASIYEDGLTVDEFNELAATVDRIMGEHLR